MDNLGKGTELNQIARFLFDSAANKFYGSWGLEVTAVGISLVSGLMIVGDQKNLFLAIISFVVLSVAYILRVQSESEYDNAETMRRQSVLSEALGWNINSVQFSEWRQKAGRKILRRLKEEKRSEDYYGTKENFGPKRLLYMTMESAFYTRCLYNKLYKVVGIILLCSLGLVILMFFVVLPIQILPVSTQIIVAYTIYLILPLILSMDLLNWFLKLGRIKGEMFRIEEGMERIAKYNNIEEAEVMRLVSEYNCQLVSGLPIPSYLFHLWHIEIKDLWEKR